MPRFLTYETNCGVVGCLTEAECEELVSLEDHAAPKEIADWVWQFAATKAQAKSQHAKKVDAWRANPTKETY